MGSFMDAMAVATEAAHRAGDFILRSFRHPHQVRSKGPQDVVTQVDLQAEEIIVRILSEAFPDHGFLGEEGHAAVRDEEYLWVIDPLDGTRNYTVGIPFFCVSIALTINGKATLGVIHDPVRGETFATGAGQGTYLNGEPVHLVPKASLEQAIVYVGFLPAANPDNPELSLPMFLRLRPSVAAMRNMGSAALSLAYVASGRVDVAYQDRLSPWDVLAGALLVEEAGGTATDFHGSPISISSQDVIAATSSALHSTVLTIAQEVLRERDRWSDG
jgi:myo-inositol-1(or 4)-monophosphatase